MTDELLKQALKLLDEDTQHIRENWQAKPGKAQTYEESSWAFSRDHAIEQLRAKLLSQ